MKSEEILGDDVTRDEITIEQPATQADTFPTRLAGVIGDMSVRAFSRKAGVSDTYLRQCLAGRTEPTRTKLLAIARAGDVSVEWLATGAAPVPGHALPDTVLIKPQPGAVDRDLLERIILITEDVLGESDTPLAAPRRARLMAAVYDMYQGADERPIQRETILKLISRVTA